MPIGKLMERQKEALLEEALKGKHRNLSGCWYYLVATLAVGTALYHIYTAYFGAPFALLFRNIHWMLIASLIFLYFPAIKKSPRDKPTLIDIGCVLTVLCPDRAIDKAVRRAYNVRCTRGAIDNLMKGNSKQACLFREPAYGESRQAALLNSSRRCGGKNRSRIAGVNGRKRVA